MDITARSIDINLLSKFVNFELPNVAEDYVHRIGRTGRAGTSGEAMSVVCAEKLDDLRGTERLIQKVLPREIAGGFEPKQALPETKLDIRLIRKRPKKHKPQRRREKPAAGNTSTKS